MKQYLVMAQAKDDTIEFISAHATLEGAQAERDRCIEGDDKHDPCEYFIEEKQKYDIFNSETVEVLQALAERMGVLKSGEGINDALIEFADVIWKQGYSQGKKDTVMKGESK